MADEVRVWKVTGGDALEEIQAASLSLEERIEKWITQDICLLQPDNSGRSASDEANRRRWGTLVV